MSQPTDEGAIVTNKVISYLQAHPSTKYVWGSYGNILLGVSQAIKVAGLSGVKLFSQGGNAGNLAQIQSGGEAATIVVSFEYEAWVSADQVARLVTGQSISNIDLETLPWFYVITKSNLDFDIQDNPTGPGPVDFDGQFDKLWRVN